jgi:hypothetical protein
VNRLLYAAPIWAALTAVAAGPAAAQQSVPSCYAAAKLPVAAPRPARSVFVFIDQTTPFTEDLRRTIQTGIQQLLSPGTTYTIATFSSLSQAHHTKILSSGTIEGSVPARVRPSLPVNKLNALDRCLVRQRQYAIRAAAGAVATATGISPAAFSRSEILSSLTHLSHAVRSSPAGERVVIIGSDLLEHSSASSFYNRRDLRPIDPRSEMARAARLGLVGNFARARVYVVGTAALAAGSGASERKASAMNSLIAFWTQWFQRSNAGAVVIGRPNLVAPVR